MMATEIGAGVRWLDETGPDFRVELAALLWLAGNRRLGVSLDFSWGSGLRIDDPDYRGRYRELVAGARVRARLLDFRRLSALVSLGGAAHWATLQGTLSERAGGSTSAANRLNGSVDIQTLLTLHVTQGVYLGASLGAAYLPAYQRYLVDGRPVFSPWPLTASLAGYCGVELF